MVAIKAPTGSVVVAGAAGFLGQHVCTEFANAGWRVLGLDRNAPGTRDHQASSAYQEWVQDDLSSVASITTLLERTKPKAWIHLAGPASVSASFENPSREFESSNLPLARILDAIRRTNPDVRFLLASSAAVYGEPDHLPIAESQPQRPISPYGFHKVHQELLLDEYRQLYGMRVCKARIFSTYGPGIRQLAVWEISRRAMAGDFSVLGSGEESRDYLYVEDIAGAFMSILGQSNFYGEAINVASGNEMRIVDLSRMVYAALGSVKDTILCPETRPGNPQRWRADVSKLKAFGFSPTVNMVEGLSRTISWIRSHA